MRLPILDRLAQGSVLVADGATGTMLQAAGLPPGTPSEAWVLDRPADIIALHRAYVDAGSEMILTTSFGGTQPRLRAAGLDARVQEINRRAAELSRLAAGDDRYVAGDIGPTGELMAPIGRLTVEAAVALFMEQAAALAAGGADLIYVETMSDLSEATAAVTAARRACGLPIFCTFSFDTRGRTSMGLCPSAAAKAMAEAAVAGVGANCGRSPEEVLDFLPQMRAAAPSAYLVAKPNAGIPRMVKRQVVYDATAERMADLARECAELGARIIGACCGSTPQHISAIARSLRESPGRGAERAP